MVISKPLESLIREMVYRGLLPKTIETSEFGSFKIVNAFEEASPQTISDSVFTGMALSSEAALAKCLSEVVERRAMALYQEESPDARVYGSDGFAAYPKIEMDAGRLARRNALAEAVERFVWANWWDSDEAEAHVEPVFLQDAPPIQLLSSLLPITRVFLIRPTIGTGPVDVQIYFAELKSTLGFISGGAAGEKGDKEISCRALAELIRHGLAYLRMSQGASQSKTFYESRLDFFASGRGRDLVLNRLKRAGSRSVELPGLACDEVVRHDYEDLFAVHRCLFIDQPVFIGGKLERLCL